MVQRQEMEEHVQKVFFRIILQEKLWQDVKQVTGRDKGGLILPKKMEERTGQLVTDILVSKHPYLAPLAVEAFHHYNKIMNRIGLNITADIAEQVSKTIQGVSGTDGIDTTECQDCTLWHGPSSRYL